MAGVRGWQAATMLTFLGGAALLLGGGRLHCGGASLWCRGGGRLDSRRGGVSGSAGRVSGSAGRVTCLCVLCCARLARVATLVLALGGRGRGQRDG